MQRLLDSRQRDIPKAAQKVVQTLARCGQGPPGINGVVAEEVHVMPFCAHLHAADPGRCVPGGQLGLVHIPELRIAVVGNGGPTHHFCPCAEHTMEVLLLRNDDRRARCQLSERFQEKGCVHDHVTGATLRQWRRCLLVTVSALPDLKKGSMGGPLPGWP